MSIFKKFLIPPFIFIIFSSTGFSQNAGVAERFSGHDPNSTARINHQPLTDYLQATVVPVGRSYRVMGNSKADSYAGSRIKTSKSLSPSRFEGSRLFVHAFVDGHKEFFRSYQDGLERLSNRRPLSDFKKNEQLAFWLNLYNVIVINKVVEEYPIAKLSSWRKTKRGKTSFWNEKITTIEGVGLSLKDIERIIIANFNKPEAVFGLWQGSIGGPRLQNYAYTGSNVNNALEINALEFVNSNRGLRPPTGTRMNVSKFYEWVLPAFGTSENHVLMFIKEYADPNFVQGVSRVTSLNFKLYNWQIADLLGGTKHRGQHNQIGGVQTAGGNGMGAGGNVTQMERSLQLGNGLGISGQSAFAGKLNTFGGKETEQNFFDVQNNLNRILDKIPTGPTEILPLRAIDILLGIKANSRIPKTIITTEECGPGEDCTIEDVNPDGA